MRETISILILLLICAGNAFSQKLPAGAVVLERAKVTPARGLILWMPSPAKHPRDAAADELYTCPDNTRGHYYTGVAHVSLVDLKTKKTIDTLEIAGHAAESGENTLDLPYLIRRTGYYDVPRLDRNKEGKPVLMKLRDYNGDGRAHEFALFDAVACMGLPTTLVGYGAERDKLLQYRTELAADGERSTLYWVDYFFGQKPQRPGFWKYEIDYRGRGGNLDRYEIRYDIRREMFIGTLESLPDPDERPSR